MNKFSREELLANFAGFGQNRKIRFLFLTLENIESRKLIPAKFFKYLIQSDLSDTIQSKNC